MLIHSSTGRDDLRILACHARLCVWYGIFLTGMRRNNLRIAAIGSAGWCGEVCACLERGIFCLSRPLPHNRDLGYYPALFSRNWTTWGVLKLRQTAFLAVPIPGSEKQRETSANVWAEKLEKGPRDRVEKLGRLVEKMLTLAQLKAPSPSVQSDLAVFKTSQRMASCRSFLLSHALPCMHSHSHRPIFAASLPEIPFVPGFLFGLVRASSASSGLRWPDPQSLGAVPGDNASEPGAPSSGSNRTF